MPTNLINPAFHALADQVRALEAATDNDLAHAGLLLAAASNGSRAADMPTMLSQSVFDSLERLISQKIEGRRELCSLHGKLRKLGKMAVPELPWGPVQPCPLGSETADAVPQAPLRIAA